MKKMAVMATAVVFAASLFGEGTTPVMVSLLTPVQAPSRSYDVTGFRMSLLYGDCRDFSGFDIGLVQRAAGEFDGLAVGGANIANGGLYGVQMGLVNWCGKSDADCPYHSAGMQVGALNYAESFAGVNYGLVNIAGERFYGFQDGFVNVTGGYLAGMQYGFVSYSGEVYGMQSGVWLLLGVNFVGGAVKGCQVGILNFAGTMEYGVQIGAVNIIANGGWLPVLPVLNGRF